MYWSFARDTPLFPEDKALPQEQLNAKRLRWLQRHDQDTAHITSTLLLVQGLPVRLIDAVDRRYNLYRGRRGYIRAWVLHPSEEPQEFDGEWILIYLPKVIYVEFPGAKWVVHEDLGPGVYPITTKTRTCQHAIWHAIVATPATGSPIYVGALSSESLHAGAVNVESEQIYRCCCTADWLFCVTKSRINCAFDSRANAGSVHGRRHGGYVATKHQQTSGCLCQFFQNQKTVQDLGIAGVLTVALQ